MLLPDKHIRLSESIIGLASFILDVLDKPKGFEQICRDYENAYGNNVYPTYHSSENLLSAILFLFMIGAVVKDEYGLLEKCA